MKKLLTVFLLTAFVFQPAIFASAPTAVKYSKTEWVMNHTVRSVLDFTYLILRKFDLAG